MIIASVPQNWTSTPPFVASYPIPQAFGALAEDRTTSVSSEFSVIHRITSFDYQFEEVRLGEEIMLLVCPVPLTVYVDGETQFRAENAELGIFVSSDTFEQVIEEFSHYLVESWHGLKDEPADRLSPGANELRKKLASYFGE